MTHSPGPWHADSERYITHAAGEPVARVSVSWPETEVANAALIAAAPEMLALLRRLSERWNADYHCCDRERGHSDDCPLAAADALLARLSTEGVKR